MSESVPLFVVPDAGWGVGWEAGSVVPLSLPDLCENEVELNLNLSLRITYVSNYVIKSKENGDYVSNYASTLTDNDAIVPTVHQQIEKMVEEIMKDHEVRVTEYSLSFGEGVFVAVHVSGTVPSVRVFCREEDAEAWRNTIATDNWGRQFTDNPPVVGLADAYFGKVRSDSFTVFPCSLVV